jgi:cytochrome bd-type quinol oxidase subunit 2
VTPWIRPAIMILALLVIVVLLALILLDVRAELTGKRTIGQHIQRWARRYVVLSSGIVFVLGALLAHFFWQP